MDDLTGLAKSIEHLTRFIQAGVGKWYKPIGIKREAEAKAIALNTMAEAYRKNCDVPIAFDDNTISFSPETAKDICERAQARLAYQEITKQYNIENIVELTKEELADSPVVPNEPIDQRWARRFFENATEISDDETQKLWAKILAGETKKKGSFSLRTLEAMKNLSQEEAKLFQEYSQYFLYERNKTYLVNIDTINNQFGISHENCMVLENAGLLFTQPKRVALFNEVVGVKLLFFTKKLCFFAKHLKSNTTIPLDILLLTSVGHELFSLVPQDSNTEYMKALMQFINQAQKDIAISMYEKKESLEFADYLNGKNLLEES